MSAGTAEGSSQAEIRVGTAGWSYKDWEGIVYPRGVRRKQHPAAFLAQYFDTIEINSSFYGHIRPELGRLWCQKVAEVNPGFLFTAKLHQSLTHSPQARLEPTSAATLAPRPDDEARAREGLDAIAGEGRLGALLIQFPISFKNTNENRDYLLNLLERFRTYPRVVEVRHASWGNEGVLRYFAEQGVAFCNIDQPLIGRSLAPAAHATARLGYVRLHGRNYDQWFGSESGADRYNYLYSVDELSGWKERIQAVAAKTDTLFVITNNHFEGKAAVNALEIRHMLTGMKVAVPKTLAERYPQLQALAAERPSETLF